MKSLVVRLWNDESAVSATEYGIIASVIAVGIIAALVLLRNNLRTLFNRVSGTVQSSGG
ncbi:MAG: Flp family type IVb pilin [Proteobacteria bacterium]|nr:Flp family type IVb pilin [Pseudomonadota bacterium]